MNIYIAGAFMIGFMPGQLSHLKLSPFEQSIVTATPHNLDSYHYIHKQSIVDDIRRIGGKTFLDSGAFSAWTLGKPINIDDYIDYVHRNVDIIRVDEGTLMFSVLDGIGDAKLTWENQAYMERKGLRPLPCFHAGEDFAYLDWYVKNYEYITLGGMVGASSDTLIKWLDIVWDKHLLDGAGKPRIKVHGFGITAVPIMERYPWWSVDSSSWAQTARYGSILMPEGLGQLEVSNRSPARHELGKHLFTMSEAERQVLLTKIAAQGFDIDRLTNFFYARAAYNIWSYNQIGYEIDAIRADAVAIRMQELF